MKREWKPGDVALIPFGDGDHVALWQGDREGWAIEGKANGHGYCDARPLVVIDPEDREQVERLRDLMDVAYYEQSEGERDFLAVHTGARGNAMQAALRELVNPKPEAFEHVVATLDQGLATALCGKVWRSGGGGVRVVGKCPECRELAGTWTA